MSKLDSVDKHEIRDMIKRYQCEKTSNIILDHLCQSNRINKAALHRSGYDEGKVRAMITDLRLALSPWDHNDHNEKENE